ncbi:cytidylyltransferase domain-containing protein [Marinospirillum sp.]|uniref:cytidylyltransferase domain-containing protein n=1 Tax=Marinospirillum sp. TaxID=2183934 RepID=UPI00384B4D73
MSSGVLITARLKSTRLHRKVLRKIGDKPMIAHLIDRMREVHLADSVTVITSTIAQDDELADFCKSYGVNCFRGEPDDVMVRMRDAAQLLDLDWVLSVTADNPWVCQKWSDRLLNASKLNNWDFGKIEGLPFGAFSYTVKKSALEKACKLKNTNDTEVWGEYFQEEFGFSNGVLKVPIEYPEHRPNYRLTVDVEDDLALAQIIEKNVKADHNTATIEKIINFLDSNKEVASINSKIKQATPKKITLKSNYQEFLK